MQRSNILQSKHDAKYIEFTELYKWYHEELPGAGDRKKLVHSAELTKAVTNYVNCDILQNILLQNIEKEYFVLVHLLIHSFENAVFNQMNLKSYHRTRNFDCSGMLRTQSTFQNRVLNQGIMLYLSIFKIARPLPFLSISSLSLFRYLTCKTWER